MWGQPPSAVRPSQARQHAHEDEMMPNFIKLTTQSELPAANSVKEFPCGQKAVCIANVNGTFSALDNVCLHQGGPLGEGVILDGKVVCPWHGWEYDAQTGVHSAQAKVAVYPLKIENGDVLIEI